MRAKYVIAKLRDNAIREKYDLDEPRKNRNEKQITRLSEFPEIDRFDIVATLIVLRPGQICEIERSSKTSISTKYYRLCY